MTTIEQIKALGVKMRAKRDLYQATSALYKLRELCFTRKTRKAKDRAYAAWEKALKERFPIGMSVSLKGCQFFTGFGGEFYTYDNYYGIVDHVHGTKIYFKYIDLGLDVYNCPCGHDNLMDLELNEAPPVKS